MNILINIANFVVGLWERELGSDEDVEYVGTSEAEAVSNLQSGSTSPTDVQ